MTEIYDRIRVAIQMSEKSRYRTDAAVERELAHECPIPQEPLIDLSAGRKDTHRDRQVESGSVLAQRCGGEIDGDACGWQ
jgi:hypothetical protein